MNCDSFNNSHFPVCKTVCQRHVTLVTGQWVKGICGSHDPLSNDIKHFHGYCFPIFFKVFLELLALTKHKFSTVQGFTPFNAAHVNLPLET